MKAYQKVYNKGLTIGLNKQETAKINQLIYYISRVASMKYYKPSPTIDVLELGCGGGQITRELIQYHRLNLYLNDIAKKNLPPKELKYYPFGRDKLLCFDVQKTFPLGDSSFDFIIAAELVEHLYDLDTFISECKRVLQDRGWLFITTPNEASLGRRLEHLYGKDIKNNDMGTKAEHIRFFSPNSLAKWLRLNGFEVDIITTCPLVIPMLRLRLNIRTNTLGHSIVLAARNIKDGIE